MQIQTPRFGQQMLPHYQSPNQEGGSKNPAGGAAQPPHQCRRDYRQGGKNHFIASLATVLPNCPLQVWCYFMPKVQMTLNMLRTSRRDPTLSAHTVLEGLFDWNRTPLAPIGTLIVVYDDPSVHGIFASHGTNAYYVGPAMDHHRPEGDVSNYRLQRFFSPSTRSYRTMGTRELYPAHCKVPTLLEEDRTLLTA